MCSATEGINQPTHNSVAPYHIGLEVSHLTRCDLFVAVSDFMTVSWSGMELCCADLVK